MLDLFEEAVETVRAGGMVALATVVNAQGSTPRATGAKMLVFKDGAIRGTIGGGEMERRVIEEALTAMRDGQPRLLHYTYREVESGDPGICGGENDIYIEVIAPSVELLVIGAGHVGQAVARLGAFLGMDCVVLDTRPEWASSERFPDARRIILGDIGEELAKYPIGLRSYLVIVTRGHLQDSEALSAVIRSPAAYIGMIGSQRKVKRVLDELRAQGVPDELLQRVHAPVGLDIGAETPEEIAVSILAEIVAVQHGRDPRQP